MRFLMSPPANVLYNGAYAKGRVTSHKIDQLFNPVLSLYSKLERTKMSSSPLRSKSYHARSVSLPSRSHPLIPQFSEHLCRLSTSEATSSSLPSISNRLSGLENLYDCVDDLLLLPQTQQRLARESNEKWAGEALDGYLRLLDACAATKDIFLQTKDDVKDQLSVLRRKRDASDIGGYLASRKKAKKVIQKLLKDLKSIENKDTLNVPALDKDHESVATFSMLKEVEAVTVSALESLLCYTLGTNVQSRRSGWSLVSKLIHHQRATCQAKETFISEFEKLDAAVHSPINFETMQNQLGELELSIQVVEEVLERLLRRLIRTRVSFLNILNN
ncbi:uncharacterized protein LOC131325554 [Rhododendron vialii]|uniref:uncharacterized protein LOC131325554 n=1 Tax=Rhododendron vialii TaxID=182163 RepID=UPI00265F6F36|nr:uncharacterized protein LOC131325554 [Rhododendron vialii]